MALLLRRRGIERVRPLAGGYRAWRDLGYPMTGLSVASRSSRVHPDGPARRTRHRRLQVAQDRALNALETGRGVDDMTSRDYVMTMDTVKIMTSRPTGEHLRKVRQGRYAYRARSRPGDRPHRRPTTGAPAADGRAPRRGSQPAARIAPRHRCDRRSTSWPCCRRAAERGGDRHLDSSVLLRKVLGQPGSLREWAAIRTGVASALTETGECLRTLDRLRHAGGLADRGFARRRERSSGSSRHQVVEVTAPVLARAAQPLRPSQVRSTRSISPRPSCGASRPAATWSLATRYRAGNGSAGLDLFGRHLLRASLPGWVSEALEGLRKRISRTPDFSSSESKISSPAKRWLMSRFCRNPPPGARGGVEPVAKMRLVLDEVLGVARVVRRAGRRRTPA